jgi:hypothetical protein
MIASTSRLVLDSTVVIALSTVKQLELLKKLDSSGFRMNVAFYEKALALMGGAKS